ncbi:hypothetical protein ACTXT7_002132 [Hymenolepis weldensis]
MQEISEARFILWQVSGECKSACEMQNYYSADVHKPSLLETNNCNFHTFVFITEHQSIAHSNHRCLMDKLVPITNRIIKKSLVSNLKSPNPLPNRNNVKIYTALAKSHPKFNLLIE